MRCSIEMRAIAVALSMAALLGSDGCSKQPPARAPLEVSIDWTCDAHGRLEPCGCFSGQHGGLSRASTILKAGEVTREQLLVDSGNAIAGTADYQVIQYRYMQQAFGSMGYLALNIGEREAQLSLPELVKLRDTSPVPMVSANLFERATGKRVFPAYRIVEEHGYRVAFVGVLGAVPEETLGAGLMVEPASSALAKALPEIKQQRVDAVVLLAFADEAAMRSLADQFYEFDLILGGKVKEPSQHLARQNRSVVLWTTNETKALGMLKTRLGGRERFAALDFNILFVNEHIPQDEKLTQLAQNYRDEIRQTSLSVDDPSHVGADEIPGVKPGASYTGSESCASCHTQAYKIWQNTGHAHAFRSLVARQSDADPNCVGCHTVGFGAPSGYRREWHGTKLAEVGCESCHGPGSEHLRERQAGGEALFHFRPLSATDCTGCHYGEFSRPFDYAAFWPTIKHGRETKVPGYRVPGMTGTVSKSNASK